MPTYTFRHKETKETSEEFMSITSKDDYLKSHPELTQVIGSPAIVDSIRVGVNAKPESGFRDLLKDMKKKHRRARINTF